MTNGDVTPHHNRSRERVLIDCKPTVRSYLELHILLSSVAFLLCLRDLYLMLSKKSGAM